MRYFIYLAYNGKNYCGWQIQPNGMTVQQRLEESLTTVLRFPISIIGAGRTDAGVHAKLMVAHFDFEEIFDLTALPDKLNALLPHDIAIDHIIPVFPGAHARFSALSRTYQYFISYKKSPFQNELMYRIRKPLDVDLMNEAAQILFEYDDFTSFSKLHTDAKTNFCKMMRAEWTEENGHLVFTIQANRFLRNMVRAIVGTLLEVGSGKLTIPDFRSIVEEKSRAVAGPSAPAHALFLADIEYPDTIFA
jgi:tRNA pseudouridine38-40 synthase